MRTTLLVLISAMLQVGCGGAEPTGPEFEENPSPSGYQYSVPVQVPGDWTTGSLPSVGVDTTRMVALMNRLRANRHHRVHSILVVRNGVLAFEEYFPGDRWLDPGVYNPVVFTRDSLHYQASVTKTVTAIAVGIAQDLGLLELDTPALSFFPRLAEIAVDGREEITLKHMLTMRSGLPWNEWTVSAPDPASHVMQFMGSSDPLRFVMSMEMEAPAGTFFRYNSGVTNVLGKVVELVSGQSLDEFTRQRLFEPLGITDFSWDLVNQDLVFASGGLHLRPRDMAKIGELFLRDGTWQGEELVSASYVAESSISRSELSLPWGDGYGYGWWTQTYATAAGPIDTYFGYGWGEQQFVVVPALDLVVVLTGGSYEVSPFLTPRQMMAEYIIPAVLEGS